MIIKKGARPEILNTTEQRRRCLYYNNLCTPLYEGIYEQKIDECINNYGRRVKDY